MSRHRNIEICLFPKIYKQENLKKGMVGIDWSKPVIVEEKFDGSNVALKLVDGEIEYYSRNKKLGKNPTGNFARLKELTTPELIKELKEGDILFCEYIGMAQLPYNKTHQILIPIEIKNNKTGKYSSMFWNAMFAEDVDFSLINPKINNQPTIGTIRDRDLMIKFVNCGESISKIDQITPIEGVIVKQMNWDGDILAREKIVCEKFTNIRENARKRKNRFSQHDIAKFEQTLIENGSLDANETDKEKIKMIMFKHGNYFYEDYCDENSSRELKRLEKHIKRDLNSAIREKYKGE